MALNPGVICSSVQAARASGVHPFNGVNFDRLALGVGLGVAQWGIGQPQNLGLTGMATGVSGTGVVTPATSRIALASNPGVILSALAGAQVAGPLAQSLATVISNGISTAFTSSAQYTGPAAGVGTGNDVSKVVVANPGTLIGILMQTLSSALGAGVSLSRVATGLGNGIASLLLQATGTGAVVGPPSVPSSPASVPTKCVVV